MRSQDMSPELLKAIKRFAATSTKGGTSVSLSFNGGPELKIDKAASDRIKHNVDTELARRERIKNKR